MKTMLLMLLVLVGGCCTVPKEDNRPQITFFTSNGVEYVRIPAWVWKEAEIKP